jgi:hypothetical protein
MLEDALKDISKTNTTGIKIDGGRRKVSLLFF